MEDLKAKQKSAILVDEGNDLFHQLADHPVDRPARHVFVVTGEEEKMDAEASLLLHAYHAAAFGFFPDFIRQEYDLFHDEPLSLIKSFSQGIKKDTWPWRANGSGVSFRCNMSYGCSTGKSVWIITLAAEYPMVHLAFLWFLQKYPHRISFSLSRQLSRLTLLLSDGKNPDVSMSFQFPQREYAPIIKNIIDIVLSPASQKRRVILALPRNIATWSAIAEEEHPAANFYNRMEGFALFTMKDMKYGAWRAVRDDDALHSLLTDVKWNHGGTWNVAA